MQQRDDAGEQSRSTTITVPGDFVVYKCKIARDTVIEIPLPREITRAEVERVHAFMLTQVDDDKPEPPVPPGALVRGVEADPGALEKREKQSVAYVAVLSSRDEVSRISVHRTSSGASARVDEIKAEFVADGVDYKWFDDGIDTDDDCLLLERCSDVDDALVIRIERRKLEQ